jgi:tetratricopeptide (TPR) repeat protein
LKQYREALTELESNLSRFENQPDLWAGRAYLLAELGDTDAALSAYAALFASGYRADAPFTQYVTLLAENDRLREALATTQQYLKVKESLTVRRLEASLDRKMGNREQAIAVLTQLLQAHPFNAEVAYDLCDTLWDSQRYEDALEICRQLLEHRYDTAHTYWLQGRCQYALKLYKPARESLEAALKREPTHKEARDLLVVVNAALVDKRIR